jgi:hypothetical protein
MSRKRNKKVRQSPSRMPLKGFIWAYVWGDQQKVLIDYVFAQCPGIAGEAPAEFLDGFRRDILPNKEMNWWLRIARAVHYTSVVFGKESDVGWKKDCAEHLFLLAMGMPNSGIPNVAEEELGRLYQFYINGADIQKAVEAIEGRLGDAKAPALLQGEPDTTIDAERPRLQMLRNAAKKPKVRLPSLSNLNADKPFWMEGRS